MCCCYVLKYLTLIVKVSWSRVIIPLLEIRRESNLHQVLQLIELIVRIFESKSSALSFPLCSPFSLANITLDTVRKQSLCCSGLYAI